jgi:hypothetical protein
MHSSAWVALFRHIPEEHQSTLMVVTASGVEIAIQSILRIEREFAAFKGRLAGSQDAGRVFFIPYAHIDYFGFQQEIKDVQFHERFDDLVIPDVEPQPAAPLAPSEALPEPEPEPELAPPPMVCPPIKSAVLERFRARSSIGPGTPLE